MSRFLLSGSHTGKSYTKEPFLCLMYGFSKNKLFVFFYFLVPTSWPTQQEFGSLLGYFSQMLRAASLEVTSQGVLGILDVLRCCQAAWERRARVSGLQGLQGKRLSSCWYAAIRMEFVQWPLLLGVRLNVLYSSEYFRGSTKHDRVCEFYLGLWMSGLLFCQWDENTPPPPCLEHCR